jgi:hypothetical protein
MKERPILFSAPMVRAILEGRKTQTRRIVKPQPAASCRYAMNGNGDKALHLGPPLKPGETMSLVPVKATSADHRLPCPYGAPGDRLWVRETFVYRSKHDRFYYRADHPVHAPYAHDGWKPSIHMPRRASRISLEVTGVRVERLHDITEDDAKAEGAAPYIYGHGSITEFEISCDPGIRTPSMYRAGFEQLWRAINGCESWDANPWVWCVSFRRIDDAVA